MRKSMLGRLVVTPLAGALGFAMVFMAAPAARADDVDTAVDVVVSVGSIAGIAIDGAEAAIIKEIVRCAIEKRPVVRCARRAIVERLPPEAQPLTACVLDGVSIDQCGAKELVRRLPPQAQALVGCIVERNDVGSCGQGLLLSAAQQQAFNVINKLKADGRSELGSDGSGAIRNIIGLSEAIRDDDWLSVGFYGGTEVYKVAAKLVLKALLPAFRLAGPLLDDVIDALIQARADVVGSLIKGAKTGDARLVGEAITTAFLINNFIVPCAISQIPEDVREAVCGPIGKIIHTIAEAGGDVADLAFRLIKDPLGIPDTLWNELEGLRGTIAGKDDDCVPPEQYYRNNYAKCYHRGVQKRLLSQGQLDQIVGGMNHRCRRYYDRCFFSHHFDGLCNPQRAMFNTHINRLTSSVDKAATLYSNAFGQFVRDKGQAAACEPQAFMRQHLPEFLDSCARSVAVHVPLAGDAGRDDCDGAPLTFSSPVVHRAACEKAMAQVDTASVLTRVCFPQVKPDIPMGCRVQGEGRCGFFDVICNRPLPPATNYVLAGVLGIETVTFNREIGLVAGRYSSISGDFTAHVCASNSVGAKCSAGIALTLGRPNDPSCFGTPVTRPCPEGLHKCRTTCIGKNEVCRNLQ